MSVHIEHVFAFFKVNIFKIPCQIKRFQLLILKQLLKTTSALVALNTIFCTNLLVCDLTTMNVVKGPLLQRSLNKRSRWAGEVFHCKYALDGCL